MSDPKKETDQKKRTDKSQESAADEFFGGPQAPPSKATIAGEPAINIQQPVAEEVPGEEGTTSSEASTTENRPLEGAATGAVKPVLPPDVQNFLLHYLEVSKKLLLSPMTFFKEMERTGGLSQPGIFLAVSAISNGALSTLLGGFNLGLIPRNCIFVSLSCFVMSGLVYIMGKGMGSKCNFATAFRVFAYCSCLSVLSPIPGLNLLTPVAFLVLSFLGLKEVLGVSLYQTITIMALVGFMQTLLTLGHMFSH